MEGEVVAFGLVEDADQVDRVALENLGVGGIDAPVLDDEIAGALQLLRAGAEAADEAVQPRRVLRLAVLQLGADDAGQVADILGDQEVVLHEALSGFEPRMPLIAEPAGELGLHVEGEPLLRAAPRGSAGGSGPPTENRRSGGTAGTPPRQQAGVDERLVGADAVK